jgi:rod shape-determining protein MreD
VSRKQVARLAVVSVFLAATQVAGFDRFLLLGMAYLALPLFLTVAMAARLPATNAALVGALIGTFWDLLSIDLFGRYALALALAGGLASLVTFRTRESAAPARIGRRAVAITVGFVVLASVSALSGETLPPMNPATAVALLLTVVVGTLVSGSILNRLALPTRIAWDPVRERSTDWVDRRAGLYSVPVVTTEREAA